MVLPRTTSYRKVYCRSSDRLVEVWAVDRAFVRGSREGSLWFKPGLVAELSTHIFHLFLREQFRGAVVAPSPLLACLVVWACVESVWSVAFVSYVLWTWVLAQLIVWVLNAPVVSSPGSPLPSFSFSLPLLAQEPGEVPG